MRGLVLLMLLATAACRGQEPTAERAAAATDVLGHSLTGRVIDEAEVLLADEERTLAEASWALEQSTGDRLVIVTVPTLSKDGIEHLSWALESGGGSGQQSRANGVLMLVAPKERRVRIVVGKGLEGLLTDARSAEIVRAMLPGFGAGRPGEAIATGEAGIIAVLQSDRRRPQRKSA